MDALRKKLAVVKRAAWNVLLDLRYGGLLRGTIESRSAHLGASKTANTSYDVLAQIFRPGVVRNNDVLIDIGCGKGRVINWWLHCGYRNKIVGIELDEAVAEKTRQRLRGWRNVEIITGNAISNLPSDGTLFFLFNPFGRATVEAFRDRLIQLIERRGDIRIFYYHPVHMAVFEDDPRWTVDHRRLSRYWPKEVAYIRPARNVNVDREADLLLSEGGSSRGRSDNARHEEDS